jgi:hypothetical protein
MKTFFSLLIALFLVQISFAQNQNINPDPNGEPWIVGGLRELTPDDYQMLARVPEWKPENPVHTENLPLQVDNTVNEWFRPIFSQSGGSCGQASGVGYNFTYEIDYERQVPANIPQNQYPTHYTWNFLNGGVGNGSWYFDGWMIIRESGCPTIYDYGGMAYGGESRWMSGYDLYYSAMHNRTLDFWTIDVSTREGLETLKQWLWSRDGGTLPGGLANFGAGIGAATQGYLPAGTHNGGQPVITQWGNTADHAMTFVGYDDEIVYDFNNDGQYTDDIDINGDGEVDLRDCEIGGLLMANSWGSGWGMSGKAWVMYKLLADPIEVGGIWANAVHLVQAKAEAAPLLTFKTTITHTSRNKLKIMCGVAADPEAQQPEYARSFPMFNHQGGDFYMQGGNSNQDKTIEIGLDITDLLTYIEPGEEARFFLQIVEQDPYGVGNGEIVNLSLMDYTTGAEETVSDMQNISILNSDTTLVWVNKAIEFDKVVITTEELEAGVALEPFSQQLEAASGTPPYTWSLRLEYTEEQITETFPAIETNQLETTSEDDGFGILPLDFDFLFYGETYNELTILTDGAITFDGNFSYIRDDGAIAGNKCIAAYCSDLMIYPAQGDGIYYEGDENSMTIRWITSKFDEPSFDLDAAVRLFPDGTIQFFLGDDISTSPEWGSGISVGDGENFLITSISGLMNPPGGFAAKIESTPFPMGMEITSNGMFQGTPQDFGWSWDIPFKVTDDNSISNLKTLTFHTLPTGLPKDDISNESVTVSPNPFKGFLNIQVENAGYYHFQLMDFSGKRAAGVFNGHLSAGEHLTWEIQDVTLSAGIYLLTWTSTHGSGTRKLILME